MAKKFSKAKVNYRKKERKELARQVRRKEKAEITSEEFERADEIRVKVMYGTPEGFK